jgi:hypothetical protein
VHIDALYEYWYSVIVSQANQTIVLYKRHNPSCQVHKTRLPHSTRRFWMDCSCPIWIVGRTPRGDIVPRQSAGFSDLKQAEAVRASLITQAKDETVHGPTVAECAEKYLASRRHELSEKTLGQHRLLLDRLTRFCESRHVPTSFREYLRDGPVRCPAATQPVYQFALRLHAEAEWQFRRAIELNPDYYEAHYSLSPILAARRGRLGSPFPLGGHRPQPRPAIVHRCLPPAVKRLARILKE